MVNAERQMQTGQQLLERYDCDMAALYFELAGEEFLRRGDYANAFVAYDKAMYCLELDEKFSRLPEIRAIISEIRKKMEEE